MVAAEHDAVRGIRAAEREFARRGCAQPADMAGVESCASPVDRGVRVPEQRQRGFISAELDADFLKGLLQNSSRINGAEIQ